MNATTSALDDARTELRRRLAVLEPAECWRERSIIAPLYNVADMVCRIGDHADSSHYRSGKSADLLSAAISVHIATCEAHGEDDGAIDDLGRHLRDLAENVGALMLQQADHGAVRRSTLDDARSAIETLGGCFWNLVIDADSDEW